MEHQETLRRLENANVQAQQLIDRLDEQIETMLQVVEIIKESRMREGEILSEAPEGWIS